MKAAALWVLSLALLVTSNFAAEPPAGRLTAVQRLETDRLKATHEARMRFARERQTLPELGPYEDLRAVIHVHAEDSDHTKGTRQQVLAAAKKTGVRVVLFTDHRGPKADTWHGLRDGVLFLAGSEDGDGVLRFPDFDANRQPRADGGLRFLSHIEERYDAATAGFVGMEIVNRHSDAKLDNGMQQALLDAASRPEAWEKFVKNFEVYPDEMFGAGSDYRPEIMAKWDAEIRKHPFTGMAANDAHRNQIFQGVTFDPYEVSFRNLTTHLLARELTEAEVRRALREGNAYVAHDWLCDPTGFAFGAVNNRGVFPMGDTALLTGTTRIVGLTPLAARLKLIHQGAVVHETNGTNLTFTAKEAGPYRLEAWLAVGGEERPWIYSNPVYLKSPTLADVPLPSGDSPPSVEVRKDLVYAEGKPEDQNKHKLDLYIPKDKLRAPVFVFIHGGAWRFGDRALYPPLGNRFAKEGILTVVPSYRLAPQNPHPAQIEDTAAAFAWVTRHIAEHGGDTNRIYIGGQSAGGHLVALLALDERYLRAHGLSAKQIRGVIAVSGVYDLTFTDSMASVFGRDKPARKDASPLFHVRAPAPPFLVTYCQWDYPSLPWQARAFRAALREAGVESELFFTPREDHITEVIAMTHDDDSTSRAMAAFIRKGLPEAGK